MNPTCTRCHKTLIPRAKWRQMDVMARARAHKHAAPAGARDLCKTCHWEMSRKGELETAPKVVIRSMTPQQIADRVEDLWWMAETGECLPGAARRLGIGERALERWMAHHELIDLRTKLSANNPRDHNRVRDDAAVTEVSGERAYRRRAREQQGSAA